MLKLPVSIGSRVALNKLLAHNKDRPGFPGYQGAYDLDLTETPMAELASSWVKNEVEGSFEIIDDGGLGDPTSPGPGDWLAAHEVPSIPPTTVPYASLPSGGPSVTAVSEAGIGLVSESGFGPGYIEILLDETSSEDLAWELAFTSAPSGDAEPTGPLVIREGTASILFEHDGQEVSLDVESASQSWAVSTERIRLPVNGHAPVLVSALYEMSTPTSITVTSSDDQVATTTGALSLDTTERVGGFAVSGASAGTATISVTPPGEPTKTINVDVVAVEVDPTLTQVTLSSMAGSDGGGVELRLPDGVTFGTITPPTGSSTYLTVSGAGSETMVLEFTDGQARPGSLTVTYTLSGTESGTDLSIAVADGIHEHDGAVTTYAVSVQVP